MVFVGMLSFQLAGALILLLNCCIGSREAVIKNCFPGTNIVARDDNDQCVIPKGKLQESAYKIYLNAAAFLDLVVGYLLASFSPVSPYSQWETVGGVAVGTIILLAGEYLFSKKLSAAIYSKDIDVPYSELEKNGVDTVATDKEVQEMLDDVF